MKTSLPALLPTAPSVGSLKENKPGLLLVSGFKPQQLTLAEAEQRWPNTNSAHNLLLITHFLCPLESRIFLVHIRPCSRKFQPHTGFRKVFFASLIPLQFEALPVSEFDIPDIVSSLPVCLCVILPPESPQGRSHPHGLVPAAQWSNRHIALQCKAVCTGASRPCRHAARPLSLRGSLTGGLEGLDSTGGL